MEKRLRGQFLVLCMTALLGLGFVSPAAADSFDNFCNNGVDDSNAGTGDSPAEKCEDRNAVDTDDCRSSCQVAMCGDGFLHTSNSDTDSGNLIPDLALFNGVTPGPLEQCDDGNNIALDGCSDLCVDEDATMDCGNGLLETDGVTPEECDDGNTDADDGCSAKHRSCSDRITPIPSDVSSRADLRARRAT